MQPLPVGDLDERGDVPPQIQKGVQFDGGFPFPKSRPREKRKAQVDRRGVEGVHRVLQFHRKGIVDVQIYFEVEFCGNLWLQIKPVNVDLGASPFVIRWPDERSIDGFLSRSDLQREP